MKHLLTIAGSDCSGGAGIQADLKSFAAQGTYGMSVITAVTAQNTQDVRAIENVAPEVIEKQIDAVFEDIRVDGVKIGMLSCVETIDAVTKGLQKYQPRLVVLDPVMVAKSGAMLLQPQACADLIKKLLPLTTVVTPNIPEAEVITGMKIENKGEMLKAAKAILALGPQYVLLKGGHFDGSPDDLLLGKDVEQWYLGERIDTPNTHGTGCSLSSSLAALLAKGVPVVEAVQLAKDYVTLGIKNALAIGHGHGPIHHFVELYEKAGMN